MRVKSEKVHFWGGIRKCSTGEVSESKPHSDGVNRTAGSRWSGICSTISKRERGPKRDQEGPDMDGYSGKRHNKLFYFALMGLSHFCARKVRESAFLERNKEVLNG